MHTDKTATISSYWWASARGVARTVRVWTLAAIVVAFGLTRAGDAADGGLDAGFGVDGIVITDFAGARDEANAAAVDGAGRIVAAGNTWSDLRPRFALARYQADGTPDVTFGDSGKVSTDLGRGAGIFDVAIDAQGRIVAAGIAQMPAWDSDGTLVAYTMDFALARYNADGSLDTSFGPDGNGTVTTALPGYQNDTISGLAIDANGRIVVAGFQLGRFALARYSPDGVLDGGFGTAGIVMTSLPTPSFAYAVALDGAGRIVVAGLATAAGAAGDVALARYNDDGSLDQTFGSGGLVVSDLGASEFARGVTVDADGRIVVTGLSGNSFLVARYTSNGALDGEFNAGGSVITAVGGSSSSSATDLAIDTTGRIVAVGYALATTESGPMWHFAVTRYLEGGSLDASFGSGGSLITSLGGDAFAKSVAFDAGGNLVLAGTLGPAGVDDATANDFAVVRYAVETSGYTFTGFFPPVDNAPVLNVVKAGSAVPVKFSLNGDYGLNILAEGSPSSQPIACDAVAPLDVVTDILSAPDSRLTYDAEQDQYIYIWKTQKAWANTCRQLVVTLTDGTSRVANFRFAK